MVKITARFIIQIAGKPVENVNKALNIVLDKLKTENEKFKVIESDLFEADLDEKTTLYAGFIEVVAKFSDSKNILDFILDYTPTSIEIEDPEKIEIDAHSFTTILNDFSSHLIDNQTQIRKLSANLHYLNNKLKELEGSKK